MTEKHCPQCKQMKPAEAFSLRKCGDRAGRLFDECRECSARKSAIWRSKNPARVIENNAKFSKLNVRLFADKILFFKAERGGCYDCGGAFPPESMDFDHAFGKKEFEISSAHGRVWDSVRRELDKCQLACANCHRVRTKNRKNNNGTPTH